MHALFERVMMIPFQSMLAGIIGWWILSGGALGSWLVGGPVVVLVAIAVRRWRPDRAQEVHWPAVPSFVLFFLGRSLIAGVDVARRTLLPSMPLAPAVLSYRTSLPNGTPMVFFAGVVSLLPGSLSVSVNHSTVDVHVLDNAMDTQRDLEQVEQRISAIFRVRGT